MNKFRPVKMLPVWIAISSVIILAGILLVSLLGFNFSAEAPKQKTVEVSYDVVVSNSDESVQALEKACDDAFAAGGISYKEKTKLENPSTLGFETVSYIFAENTEDAALVAAAQKINEYAATVAGADIFATPHTLENLAFGEADWRGEVAIVVGAIVALVYVGVRFGVSSALTGFVTVLHDVLFTLSVFAIARIPVYAISPMLLSGIAAACSLILWLVRCGKMREDFKDPAYASLNGAEAVEESCMASWKLPLFVACGLAAVILAVGAIATAAVRVLVLPALIAVAVSVYSSLLFAPAVLAPIRKAFARFTVKKKRYVGKKKQEDVPAEE